MKITYFEFPERIVESRIMPSTLCYVVGSRGASSMFRVLAMADRAYHIDGNKQIEIKNRNEQTSTKFISDEDKIVLKLRAVSI